MNVVEKGFFWPAIKQGMQVKPNVFNIRWLGGVTLCVVQGGAK